MRTLTYMLVMVFGATVFWESTLFAETKDFAGKDYMIVHQKSGLLLDTTYWKPQPGQAVKVYPRNPDGRPTPSQLWVIEEHQVVGWLGQPMEKGYAIVHKSSGLLLDTTYWNPKDGQEVKVFPRGPDGKPTRSQLWRISNPHPQVTGGRACSTITRIVQEEFGNTRRARYGCLDTERWNPVPGQTVKVFQGDVRKLFGGEMVLPTPSQRWDLVPLK